MDSNFLIYFFKEYRERVINNISNSLDSSSYKRALKDHHSRRKPRPCGLTIHTGIGCPYQCIYCYIYSMGFPKKIDKYPLTPLELLFAIANNKNVVLGPYGTFLAIGSVTEPFHPLIKDYTIDLINYIFKFLRNPTQVSTKAVLDSNDIDKLKDAKKLSILYTITTLKYYKHVEPYAPSPYDRLRSMKILRMNDFHVTLFIRPFIPGIIEEELESILMAAKKVDVKNVIFGTMRVNRYILNNFKSDPILYRNIVNHLPGNIDDKLRILRTSSLKSFLVNKAKELGFRVFPSACAATIDAFKQACNMCTFGPCGDAGLLPRVDEELIKEFLDFIGVYPLKIELNTWSINIVVKNGRKINNLKDYLSTVTRRKVYIKII